MTVLEATTKNIRKKIIGRTILIFLGIMLALTFFSNTINNFSLPKVTIENPSSGALVKDITGSGTVEANSILDLYVQTNLLVLDAKVEVGDKVKKGQLLFTLDTSDIISQLKDEQDKLEQKNLNLEKLINIGIDLNMTSEDLIISNSDLDLVNNDINLTSLNRSIETAKDTMDNNKKSLDIIESGYQAGTETADSYKTAKFNYENSKKEYDIAVSNKENAIENNKTTIRNSEANKRNSLRDIRNNQRDIKSNQSDVKNTQLDIEIEQRKISELKEQLKLNKITAPSDGVITELNFSEGLVANNSHPLYKLAETTKGFLFTATVDIDSVTYLTIGDDVEVTINSLKDTTIQGKLDQIEDNQQQKGVKKNLLINIPSEGLTGGESGNISIRKNIGSYTSLVSNSAVGQDNTGYFVYILKERKGPIGNEYYVQKAYITVKDSDDLKTAVLSGIGNFEKVIATTDKALSDGTRVVLT